MIDARNDRIATLEAEVRRLTAERDEARADRDYWEKKWVALETTRAMCCYENEKKLATLSRLFRNYVDSALSITATIDPNKQRAFDLNAWRTLEDLMQSARREIAALDSGGGEGEKASAGGASSEAEKERAGRE